MAVSHIKSNPIADMTGTVTVFGSDGSTQTVAATDLVRPSDWNSAHGHIVTLGGNTAGASTVSGTNIVYAGGNNVTVSGVQGANVATINISAADQSTHSHSTAPGAIAAGTQTATSGTIVFADSNGVAFGLSGSTQITASYSQSTHSHSTGPGAIAAGTQTATSGTIVFVDSNGLAFGMSGSTQITGSYSQSTHGHSLSMFAVSNTTQSSSGTQNVNAVSFAGAGAVSVGVTNGSVVVSAPNTVAQTNQTAGIYAVGNTTGQSSSSTYDARTLSIDGAGLVSVGWSNGTLRISGTGRASTDAIGLNTAQSNVTWTVNSSGISLDARGYAGTGTTFNGGGVSGSMTVNSIGVQLSLSANAGTVNQTGPNIGVSNLGNTAGSTGTVSTGNVVFVGSNNITLSQSTGAVGSNATITILGKSDVTIGGWEPIQANNNSTYSSMGQNTLYLQKMVADANYSFNNIEFRMSGSFASSTNAQTVVHTIRYGIYSLNTANNSYSSLGSSSIIISASYNSNTAMGYTISQGAGSYTTTSGGTAIASLMTGLKHLYLPFTSTLSEGIPYGVVFHISSASTGSLSAHRMSILNQTIMNNLTIGKVFATSIVASNASHVGDYEQGVLSVTTAALPTAIAKSDLTNAVSQARLYMQFDA